MDDVIVVDEASIVVVWRALVTDDDIRASLRRSSSFASVRRSRLEFTPRSID